VPTRRTCPSDVPLHPLIAERWSPRALDPSRTISDGQLVAILEAARWAPSFGNRQPWRFLVGRRGDETFGTIHRLLFENNQVWTGNAAALILGCTVTHAPDGSAMLQAPYELGVAVAQLALQAQDEGLVAHQLGGFDADKASVAFSIPDHVRPYVVVAVGYLAEARTLPEHLRPAERARRERRRVREIAFSTRYGQSLYLR
jgi:nitroreductase